ncbi:MAG TPA: hypothetical protein VKY65_04170 [Alphaproteobacteria bacterium]|nr:hypothetical protein [Alphaproteobacteria bacterium]
MPSPAPLLRIRCYRVAVRRDPGAAWLSYGFASSDEAWLFAYRRQLEGHMVIGPAPVHDWSALHPLLAPAPAASP